MIAPHLERKWIVTEPVIPDLSEIQGVRYPNLVLSLLKMRGIHTQAEAAAFLDYRSYQSSSPTQLPGMQKGVERIVQAIHNDEHIGVWGDFDVDGQTATSILVHTLRLLGARVSFHIPIRASESHGIKLPNLEKFINNGIQVLITCDTGISENQSISYAQENGIDTIITDHHNLPDSIPPAYAVINPHLLPEGHPLSFLAGAGVAYKFSEALLDCYHRLEMSNDIIDLAALGCIADLATLRGDTRFIAQKGLDQIRNSPRLSLKALLDAAEINHKEMNEEQISYVLAPRLNALGRLADANSSVEFLLSHDPEQIAVMANQLEGLNSHRKILCDQVFQASLAMIDQNHSILEKPIMILYHPEWPTGVVGIVASRLVERFHKPAILLSGKAGATIKGSARSIGSMDIIAAISANKQYLTNFGGHTMAAGLSLEYDQLSAFSHGIMKTAESMGTIMEPDPLNVDMHIQPAAFNLDLAKSLTMLSPFGPGNPRPIFMCDGMQIERITAIGRSREHKQLHMRDIDDNIFKILWWNGEGFPVPEGRFDLAYSIYPSTYRGLEEIRFEWIDWRHPEKDVIPVLTQKRKIQNFDHRKDPDPIRTMNDLMENYHPIIWKEGTDDYSLEGSPRSDLSLSKNMVIWTSPPDMQVLTESIKLVKPEQVFWFLIQPNERSLNVFLKTLWKKIKDKSNNGCTQIDVIQISQEMASNHFQVHLGLSWLAEKGLLHLKEMDIYNTSQKEVEINSLIDVENKLKLSFQETKAFNRFLGSIDLSTVFEDLG